MSNRNQEIEAKFYVNDLDGVRVRLQGLEARLIQTRLLETNIRFDLPGGGLGSEGRILRLRKDTQARLTYKGPGVKEQGILSRTEIEFIVEDAEKAQAMFEALGYRPVFFYEKYRATYEFLQTSAAKKPETLAHIMLDELPYGNFVEIEGESVESIHEIADTLRLKWENAIPQSYHGLFRNLCMKHRKLDPARLSFAALENLVVTARDLSVRPADG